MCFIEFVGYTCGHTSLPVLRACPLTTASHTFPTCPRRGDKAFFAGEMCSACQRIVHSRATQIEEYEHRFMHERGVCGCETVFPYLIRPRAIGSCGGGGSERGDGGGEFCGELCGEHADDAGCAAHGGRAGHHHERSSPRDAHTIVQLPPLLCESMDDGGRAVVSVRLPSLYAAEWVADHRARHVAGLCSCRVDFRTYQEAMCAGEPAGAATPGDEQDEQDDPSPRRILRRTASLSALSQGESLVRGQGLTRSSSHQDMPSCARGATGVGCDWLEAQSAAMGSRGPLVPAAGMERDAGATAGPAAPPPDHGQPVRYAGAVFAEVPAYLKLMGPFLAQPSPFAQEADQAVVLDGVLDAGVEAVRPKETMDEGADRDRSSWARLRPRTPRRHRAQDMGARREHHAQHARKRDPLVGFPIGAGPEGVPHALPWRNEPPCWRRS